MSKICIFLLPIVILAYGLDLFISTNLKNSTKFAHLEYPIWNDVLNGKLDADIFIHGSSRAWVHFDPQILEDSLGLSAYNLGVDGHTFNLQELRHRLALKHNKKPEMVIYSVDATTLQEGNFFNSEQILPYMLWNEDLQSYTSKYVAYSYFDYKIPLIRYYSQTDAIATALNISLGLEDQPTIRRRGYQGQDRTWNSDFEKAKKLMKSYKIVVNDDLKVRFDAFLKDAKNNDIEVVLVYAPVYIEGQEFISNENEVKRIYADLAKKYDFKYFDFTDDAICFDKKYFYNARHMNKTGSERFTKKLAAMIKENQ